MWSSSLFACTEDLSNCITIYLLLSSSHLSHHTTIFDYTLLLIIIMEIVDEGCLTCWCPCITFGQIAEIVDEGFTSCALSGGIYAALLSLTGCACCYACMYRTKMRAKFNLKETCGDCIIHCCCDLCALCQEYRELKHRGYDPALGWIGNQQRQRSGMGTAMAPPVNPTMARRLFSIRQKFI